MELIHSLPKKNLVRGKKPYQEYELYLVDEVLKDPEFYRENVYGTPGYKILDNSLNELGFARGLELMNKAAEIIGADEFVIPDDRDPNKSKQLLIDTLDTYQKYDSLKNLKKMAVVHGLDYIDLAKNYTELLLTNGVDVVSFPKVATKRAQIVYYLGSGRTGKEVHFLGFIGFEEFAGFREVTEEIRTLDSRMMLETTSLIHREDILTHVTMDGDREIKNVKEQIKRVRREYEAYGLR